MLLRRSLLLAVVAGFLVTLAAPSRAAEQDPKAFVDRLANDAMNVMTIKSLSDQERAQRFRTIFVGSVDMPEIGKFVLGRYWRATTTTAQQQQDFLKAFEEILVLTWSTRFKDYAGGFQHEVVGVNPDGSNGMLVESLIKRDKQDPIILMWRLRGAEGNYKVVDLAVEGAWMAITYRSEYASVMQNNGGRMESLLATMQKKIAQLQAEPAAAQAGNATRAN